ncbi:MAG: hypothetical protein LBJ72_05590, partial [Dysgonamonadaceae bacterium]|nr:hypothetical protein [Dysgonamonadaceae bacterium]
VLLFKLGGNEVFASRHSLLTPLSIKNCLYSSSKLRSDAYQITVALPAVVQKYFRTSIFSLIS